MITQKAGGKSMVIWQSERSEDEPHKEDALLITEYSDVINIQQYDNADKQDY